MYAVVVRVNVIDREAILEALPERVVPLVFRNPGLIDGYWTMTADNGLAMIVLDSEENANRAAEKINASGPFMPHDVVVLEDVEVREVVARAER